MARSIVNRRNALVGWVVISVARRVAKRKARQAIPALEDGRPNKSAIAAATFGAVSVLLFLHKHRRSGDAEG